MERSSRVLLHGNQNIWLFFSRKFEIEFDLYFDLCWRAEIIQVGLNMHLYVVIGDASSSLWGSTSSLFMILSIFQPHKMLCCHANNFINAATYYAFPSSGEAYRNRRLTTNFELWVEFFCVPTCFHVRIPKPCLSVCLYIIIASSISVLH